MSDLRTVRRVLAESHDYRRHPPRVGPGIIVRRTQSPFQHILDPNTRNSGWPVCLRCRTIVQGYGLEHEAATYVDVWAQCHGDRAVLRLRRPTEGYHEWLSEVLRTLTFFESTGP